MSAPAAIQQHALSRAEIHLTADAVDCGRYALAGLRGIEQIEHRRGAGYIDARALVGQHITALGSYTDAATVQHLAHAQAQGVGGNLHRSRCQQRGVTAQGNGLAGIEAAIITVARIEQRERDGAGGGRDQAVDEHSRVTAQTHARTWVGEQGRPAA